ncbi:MAG: hypothetical protein AB7L41_04305 [Flavobacteriaceae bacterium]
MRITSVLVVGVLLTSLSPADAGDRSDETDAWDLRGAVADDAPQLPELSPPMSAPKPVREPALPHGDFGTILVYNFEPPAEHAPKAKRVAPRQTKLDKLPDFVAGMPLVEKAVALSDTVSFKLSRHHIESRIRVPVALAAPKYSRIIFPREH